MRIRGWIPGWINTGGRQLLLGSYSSLRAIAAAAIFRQPDTLERGNQDCSHFAERENGPVIKSLVQNDHHTDDPS
ncbi:hypothetical protein BP00DRAFT_441427 [Aspergillus indologenus CBS 114.80]|uniref:Uncharacterized protein n=1 Tax=Aspergillus indologenus CBS 114.80 TaxID=1450541 RepID=A0A2V5IJR3_9EURO|nr:hypothetical protein BP00DRAFT_441427 [Aspergillus indologenus CBS 114.80]